MDAEELDGGTENGTCGTLCRMIQNAFGDQVASFQDRAHLRQNVVSHFISKELDCDTNACFPGGRGLCYRHSRDIPKNSIVIRQPESRVARVAASIVEKIGANCIADHIHEQGVTMND